jgi:YD repeat-containing protein
MKLIQTLFIAAMLGAAGAAQAQRTPEPILNLENVQVPANKALSADAVRKAIVDGGASGPRKWIASTTPDGRLRLTYNVRSHMVSVNVTNTATSYSLVYADSVNMKYAVNSNGVAVIHPFYNLWLKQLQSAIDAELSRL